MLTLRQPQVDKILFPSRKKSNQCEKGFVKTSMRVPSTSKLALCCVPKQKNRKLQLLVFTVIIFDHLKLKSIAQHSSARFTPRTPLEMEVMAALHGGLQVEEVDSTQKLKAGSNQNV